MKPVIFARLLCVGGLSGFAATVPMTAFMLAADRLGWKGREGPEAIVQQALDTVSVPRTRRQELLGITGAHFAFGTGCGAVYGAVSQRLAQSLPPVVSGIGFGIGVWLANYQGWVPAAGILPPGPHDRRDRQARVFWAHIVYGATLGWATSRVSRA